MVGFHVFRAWRRSKVACLDSREADDQQRGGRPRAVTDTTVPLSDPQYYVTLKRETTEQDEPAADVHLVVADGACDELDTWLEAD
ncbi:hypothetical protein [Natrinema amylolyticum]|uniref:hypothetical protein n=1 Tax=Natrinema amylolyticum TaxID=2878679 RepID=UPI001CFC3680|nr:hypothetical protein [Natrinema amylolyticum]